MLDLFCGAGGAAMGYARAGFEVVGVDIAPQPNFPFAFFQADALMFPLDGFDVIHASPPCQAYTSLTRLGKGAGVGAPRLIEPMRALLVESGVPYVIENVPGAPLLDAVRYCGSSFGLAARRHRLFESSWPLVSPTCAHNGPSIGIYGDHPQISKGMNRAHTLAEGRAAMGIDWMTWAELRESIPPAYTEHVGRQLIDAMEVAA